MNMKDLYNTIVVGLLSFMIIGCNDVSNTEFSSTEFSTDSVPLNITGCEIVSVSAQVESKAIVTQNLYSPIGVFRMGDNRSPVKYIDKNSSYVPENPNNELMLGLQTSSFGVYNNGSVGVEKIVFKPNTFICTLRSQYCGADDALDQELCYGKTQNLNKWAPYSPVSMKYVYSYMGFKLNIIDACRIDYVKINACKEVDFDMSTGEFKHLASPPQVWVEAPIGKTFQEGEKFEGLFKIVPYDKPIKVIFLIGVEGTEYSYIRNYPHTYVTGEMNGYSILIRRKEKLYIDVQLTEDDPLNWHPGTPIEVDLKK